MFEAYCRPEQKIITLKDKATKPASLDEPKEPFISVFSHNAHCIVNMNSSVLCIIHLNAEQIKVTRELRVMSKPLHAAITDEGDILAIVPSRDMAIIYDLKNDAPKTLQVIRLTSNPTALALGPGGSVLAIAYNNYIEVCEVGPDVAAQQRRTIRCQGIESMRFSNDGLTLVGSSMVYNNPKLLTIEIPFSLDMPEDLSFQEACAHHWASEVFVPNIIDTFSHSSLIQGGPSLFSKQWVVGYDTKVKAFKLSDLENCPSGTINFVGPGIDGNGDEPPPETVPAVNKTGQILAAGFKGSGVWIYGTPQSLEQPMPLQLRRTSTGRGPELIQQWKRSKKRTNSQRLRRDLQGPRCLIYGQQLTPENHDTRDIRWVCDVANDSASDRLVLLQSKRPEDDDPESHYETRIAIFDFQRWHKNGTVDEITFEIGKSCQTFLPDPSIGQLSEISSLSTPLLPPILGTNFLSAPTPNRSYPPHESDADNWVMPPPPYSAEPPNEEPSFHSVYDLPPLSLSNGALVPDTPLESNDWQSERYQNSSLGLTVPSYAASVASGTLSPRAPMTPARSPRGGLELSTPGSTDAHQPSIFDLETFPTFSPGTSPVSPEAPEFTTIIEDRDSHDSRHDSPATPSVTESNPAIFSPRTLIYPPDTPSSHLLSVRLNSPPSSSTSQSPRRYTAFSMSESALESSVRPRSESGESAPGPREHNTPKRHHRTSPTQSVTLPGCLQVGHGVESELWDPATPQAHADSGPRRWLGRSRTVKMRRSSSPRDSRKTQERSSLDAPRPRRDNIECTIM